MDNRNWKRSRWARAILWSVSVAVSCAFGQVSSTPLSKDKVLDLLTGGVSSRRVAVLVRERKIDFALDAATEDKLRQAGATEALVATLKNLARPPASQSRSSSAAAAPTIMAHADTVRPQEQPAAVAANSELEAQGMFADAQAALKSKRYEDAAVLFGRAIRLKPGWASPLVERAKLEAKLGQFAETMEDCSEALKLNPTDAVALNFRGFARYSLNKIDDAISDYNAAIRADPDYSEAYTNRGNAKWALRDKEGANRDFATAAQLKNKKR